MQLSKVQNGGTDNLEKGETTPKQWRSLVCFVRRQFAI